MARLVALKKIRYPRGAGCPEHQVGDEFESVSEKDTNTLVKARLAKRADDSEAKPGYGTRDMQAETSQRPAPSAVAPMSTENTEGLSEPTPSKRVYKRRDQRAEE